MTMASARMYSDRVKSVDNPTLSNTLYTTTGRKVATAYTKTMTLFVPDFSGQHSICGTMMKYIFLYISAAWYRTNRTWGNGSRRTFEGR